MSRVSKSFCKDAGCVESLNDESLTKELQSFLWAQDFRVKKRIAFEKFQSGGFCSRRTGLGLQLLHRAEFVLEAIGRRAGTGCTRV